jgi:hypothetical protein
MSSYKPEESRMAGGWHDLRGWRHPTLAAVSTDADKGNVTLT